HQGMRIMAVTKTVPIERILPVLTERQIMLIGESRWQEAKDKLPQLPAGIEKHFIGHLQTNKVKEVVAAFDAIETIDSDKLLLAVAVEAQKQGKVLPIFLQVNVSNDPAKFGFGLTELAAAVEKARSLPTVKLVGLMTIAAQASEAMVRKDYKTMKQLQLKYGLEELSMGMSDDWQIAAEEGATIVRLGTALFGQRFPARIQPQ
ncbi:MAG: YggS family pyridoxal phosphate-dependent enzyme, partial [Candidatus Kerfeldbacteria bacterium]|nr:YggS family pyridoxal phosphate-dependent enzyme [Candidatus Kerfeldbacteria bacterium]